MSSTVIPTLRYHDAPTMIDWLGRVFGFRPHVIVPDDQGGIAHAQLSLGTGMVMIGSWRDDEFGRLQPTARVLGGTSQSPYLVIADVDGVHARAVEAGAEIVLAPRDEAYGGRGFSCRDPEGQLWNVGSYDPWASPA